MSAQNILLKDDLSLLLKYVREEILVECEIMQFNEPEKSPREYFLGELEILQSKALEYNALRVVLALEEIINAFAHKLKDFDTLTSTPDLQPILDHVSSISETIEAKFSNLFNKDKSSYTDIKDALETIYAQTSLDTKPVKVKLLEEAIDAGARTHIGLILSDLKVGKEDSELSDNDLFGLFLHSMLNDNSTGFQILYETPALFKIFENNEAEFVTRSVTYDAAKILACIINTNEHVYEIYNAKKIAQVIVDTGSLLGLQSVFTEKEVAQIFKKYDLKQFTKQGKICWKEGENLTSAHTEAIRSQIMQQAHDSFEIRKKVCNINELAKLAARHDAPNALKVLMDNEEYDEYELPPETLAAYAAWDNAPKTLEMLLNTWAEAYNSSFDGKKPEILVLAKIAITEHADKALQVILNLTDFSLEYVHNPEEGPVLFDLALTAIEQGAHNCLKMLLSREEYSFKGNALATYEQILATHQKLLAADQVLEEKEIQKEEAEANDSGCDNSPYSPLSTASQDSFTFGERPLGGEGSAIFVSGSAIEVF